MKSIVLTTILFAGFFLHFGAKLPNPHAYEVGDKAEDFKLKNVDGSWVSLNTFEGVKGYIVVFTCNHCPYAQLYEHRIIDLHHDYAPKGFPVVAINPNSPLIVEEDSYEEMQKRASKNGYPFKYLFDEDQNVYPLFGATRTPHVFILDKDMIVRYIGAIDDNPESEQDIKVHYVRKAVDALLKNELPNPDYTRAVGCTVKKKP